MNVIENDIHALIEKELRGANERFPLFASMHEAYAVISEERDEAALELDVMTGLLSSAWRKIKTNNPDAMIYLRQMKRVAEKLAVEACQVAAMCEKVSQSAAEWDERTMMRLDR